MTPSIIAPENTPAVSVLIVNYDSGAHLSNAVQGLMEQSLADIATVVDRVARGLSGPEADAVKDNLFCDDTVPEIKDLPDFLARRVLSEGQEYTVGACSSTIRSKGVASPPPPPNGTAHSTNSTISPRIPAYVPC